MRRLGLIRYRVCQQITHTGKSLALGTREVAGAVELICQQLPGTRRHRGDREAVGVGNREVCHGKAKVKRERCFAAAHSTYPKAVAGACMGSDYIFRVCRPWRVHFFALPEKTLRRVGMRGLTDVALCEFRRIQCFFCPYPDKTRHSKLKTQNRFPSLKRPGKGAGWKCSLSACGNFFHVIVRSKRYRSIFPETR